MLGFHAVAALPIADDALTDEASAPRFTTVRVYSADPQFTATITTAN
jgi:hypothetical protein